MGLHFSDFPRKYGVAQWFSKKYESEIGPYYSDFPRKYEVAQWFSKKYEPFQSQQMPIGVFSRNKCLLGYSVATLRIFWNFVSFDSYTYFYFLDIDIVDEVNMFQNMYIHIILIHGHYYTYILLGKNVTAAPPGSPGVPHSFTLKRFKCLSGLHSPWKDLYADEISKTENFRKDAKTQRKKCC